jgi:hypothetical protein
MKTILYLSALLCVIVPQSDHLENVISQNVIIDIYVHNDVASAMPAIKSQSIADQHKRRFEYVLMNEAKMHQPGQFEIRKEIWSLYPDTNKLKKDYLLQFETDTVLLNYFQFMMEPLLVDGYQPELAFNESELMKVAARFFYCDQVTKDTIVKAHVCVGINGVKETNWEKDITVLAAFSYEAIFENNNDLIWEAFDKHLKTVTETNRLNYLSEQSFLSAVKLGMYEKMGNDSDVKSELMKYYQQNKENLSFRIVE